MQNRLVSQHHGLSFTMAIQLQLKVWCVGMLQVNEQDYTLKTTCNISHLIESF